MGILEPGREPFDGSVQPSAGCVSVSTPLFQVGLCFCVAMLCGTCVTQQIRFLGSYRVVGNVPPTHAHARTHARAHAHTHTHACAHPLDLRFRVSCFFCPVTRPALPRPPSRYYAFGTYVEELKTKGQFSQTQVHTAGVVLDLGVYSLGPVIGDFHDYVGYGHRPGRLAPPLTASRSPLPRLY